MVEIVSGVAALLISPLLHLVRPHTREYVWEVWKYERVVGPAVGMDRPPSTNQ